MPKSRKAETAPAVCGMSRRLFSLLTWQSTKVPIKIRWEQHPGSFVPRLCGALCFSLVSVWRAAQKDETRSKSVSPLGNLRRTIVWHTSHGSALWSRWKIASHIRLICQEHIAQPLSAWAGRPTWLFYFNRLCQINTLTSDLMTRGNFARPVYSSSLQVCKDKRVLFRFFFCIPALFVHGWIPCGVH